MRRNQEAVRRILLDEPIEIPTWWEVSDSTNMVTGYAAIRNSAGEAVAVVGVDLPLPPAKAVLRQVVLLVLMLTAFATAIMMSITYGILRRRLIAPIEILTHSADRMVSNLGGEEPVSIDIHTDDELETLAESFEKMDLDIREHIREIREMSSDKERILAELEVAARIQYAMLPRLEPPYSDSPRFELAGTMDPARDVGGDFYGFFLVDEDHLALVIADTSGKGIPAALFMVISKVLIRDSVRAGLSPGEALKQVNERLVASNDTGHFVTVWLAVIDLATGEGVSANAGHEHPASGTGTRTTG